MAEHHTHNHIGGPFGNHHHWRVGFPGTGIFIREYLYTSVKRSADGLGQTTG
jgi:hypothetical protein